MGKRIYNGNSGVMPASQELREQNRRANAAVWGNLLPEIRQRYLDAGAKAPVVLESGNRAQRSIQKQLSDNAVANSLGLGKGGKQAHRH